MEAQKEYAEVKQKIQGRNRSSFVTAIAQMQLKQFYQ